MYSPLGITKEERGACGIQHLNLLFVRKTRWEIPRSEPDSGNPTVRDRRGASGNVKTRPISIPTAV